MKKLTFIVAVLFTLALGACTDNQQKGEGTNTQSNEMDENMNDGGAGGQEWEETDDAGTNGNTGTDENTGNTGMDGDTETDTTQNNTGGGQNQQGQDPNY